MLRQSPLALRHRFASEQRLVDVDNPITTLPRHRQLALHPSLLPRNLDSAQAFDDLDPPIFLLLDAVEMIDLAQQRWVDVSRSKLTQKVFASIFQ